VAKVTTAARLPVVTKAAVRVVPIYQLEEELGQRVHLLVAIKAAVMAANHLRRHRVLILATMVVHQPAATKAAARVVPIYRLEEEQSQLDHLPVANHLRHRLV
jgi:hypothetical protein